MTITENEYKNQLTELYKEYRKILAVSTQLQTSETQGLYNNFVHPYASPLGFMKTEEQPGILNIIDFLAQENENIQTIMERLSPLMRHTEQLVISFNASLNDVNYKNLKNSLIKINQELLDYKHQIFTCGEKLQASIETTIRERELPGPSSRLFLQLCLDKIAQGIGTEKTTVETLERNKEEWEKMMLSQLEQSMQDLSMTIEESTDTRSTISLLGKRKRS